MSINNIKNAISNCNHIEIFYISNAWTIKFYFNDFYWTKSVISRISLF